MAQEEIDPAALAEAVKGLTDEELAAQIKGFGVDEVLRQIFGRMEGAFVREQATAADEGVVQWDLGVEGEKRSWSVAIAPGACTATEGPTESPRIGFDLALTDFIRVVLGLADPTQLFMSGKIRLRGDMMYAMRIQSLFDRGF